MFCVILKATNSSFQKSMTFCCGIYVKKVMKLLAFIFEQPSYTVFAYSIASSDCVSFLYVFVEAVPTYPTGYTNLLDGVYIYGEGP